MLEAINQPAAAFSAIHSQGSSDSSAYSAKKTVQQETETKQTKIQQVRTEPGQKKTAPDGRPRDSVELSQEAEEIRKLQVRDREVRAHEAAHAAAGGAYAGAPTYSYERGPDGGTYAVGGEVSIDVSPIKGDPAATLQKAQQIRAAALAPAEPSAQDMRVAQKAMAMAAKARGALSEKRSEELQKVGRSVAEDHDVDQPGDSVVQVSAEPASSASSSSAISTRVSHLDIRA